MSFLSTFASEMRSLEICRKTKTRNAIWETVETEGSPVAFNGIILLRKPGYDKMVDGQVPMNISTHVLYTELTVGITRDDIIQDQDKRFIVKNIETQIDFGGKDDHQIISIDHIE